MSLVGVEHLGMQPESTQGAHPADAEHDLLAEAVLDVAAVEPVGDALRFERFPGTVVSSRYSGIRPTSTRQIAAATCPARSTRICSPVVGCQAVRIWGGNRSVIASHRR